MSDPKAPSDWLKVDGIDVLVEFALNLHWSWNHAADELWKALDENFLSQSWLNTNSALPHWTS